MKDNGMELLVDGGPDSYRDTKTQKIIVSKCKCLSNPCFFRKQGFFVALNDLY